MVVDDNFLQKYVANTDKEISSLKISKISTEMEAYPDIPQTSKAFTIVGKFLILDFCGNPGIYNLKQANQDEFQFTSIGKIQHS